MPRMQVFWNKGPTVCKDDSVDPGHDLHGITLGALGDYASDAVTDEKCVRERINGEILDDSKPSTRTVVTVSY